MTPDQRDEITASVAAHEHLGPRYDAAVAEGLVERIGEEIDKRVDARLRTMNQQAPATPAAAPPATPARGAGSGLVLAIVSLVFGTGATSVVLSNAVDNAVAQTLMVLLIWTAIAVINVANARRR
jgi:anti-sigma factor RsiW